MKKTNLLTLGALCLVLAFTSCSKSDNAAVEVCHECHIALPDKNETAWDLVDADGEHIEFCDQALTDIESANAVYTVLDTLYADGTGDTLLPGEYGPGSANSQYEIHCEDHGDHDDDH